MKYPQEFIWIVNMDSGMWDGHSITILKAFHKEETANLFKSRLDELLRRAKEIYTKEWYDDEIEDFEDFYKWRRKQFVGEINEFTITTLAID